MTALILPNAVKLSVHADAKALAAAMALRIADLVEQAIAARGVCRIALAGGETPRRCYAEMSTLPVDWAHVHIYFGDERCLPAGDGQRNDTMAQLVLLNHVAIPATNVHCIPAELGAEVAAARYALEMNQAMPLDLVLLGMGEDGHTASLFPGYPALQSRDSVVAVFDAPNPPPVRVTLSMATLNAARRKLFLVGGVGKRAALQRIARGEPLPAGQVTEAEWYVEQDALPSA
jgi:6-phosphogluconolactonase